MTSIVEKAIGSKFYVVKTDSYYQPVTVSNDIEVTPNINQLDSFKKLVPKDSDIVPASVKASTGFVLEDFYKNLYFRVYKNITKIFFNSSTDSIFNKSKEELGIDYSGLDILRSLDMSGIVDVQQLKDEVFNTFMNDPCLAVDAEPDPEMHPLRLQIVKGNYYLSCRTHILDFHLRNLLTISIFDNNQFYQNDTSYINYIYDTYIQRLASTSVEYFTSIKDLLYKELLKIIDSGIELINPITNKPIQIVDNKELDSLSYLRYLFDNQFIFMMNEFNSFFSQEIKISNNTIKLSNLEKIQNYFINNIFQTKSVVESPINSISLLYNFIPSGSKTNVNLSLIIKSNVTTEYLSLVETSTLLEGSYNNVDQLPQELDSILKQSIINSTAFNLLFNYIFPLNKILNFSSITQIVLCSKTNQNVNINFKPAIKTLETIHNAAIGDAEKTNCQVSDLNFSFGFDVEILKFIAQAPIQIIKGLEETFDPNIAIASKLKLAAESLGAPDVSIIPYSAPLLIPPPFGPAIPLIPPWGYIYWGISAGEAAQSWSNGFKVGGIPDFSGSFQKKNPFKPLC